MAQFLVCVYGLFLFFHFSFVHGKPSGLSAQNCWFERQLDWNTGWSLFHGTKPARQRDPSKSHVYEPPWSDSQNESV